MFEVLLSVFLAQDAATAAARKDLAKSNRGPQARPVR